MLDDPKAGINTYQKYLAVRNHFKTGYDFFKYSGSVTVKPETYLKRNDKVFFQKVEKKYKGQLTDFLVGNFVYGNEWIGKMVGDVGEKNYNAWTKRLEGIYYFTKADIEKVLLKCEDFNSALKGPGHPLLFRMYLAREIDVTTICVIDSLTGFLSNIQTDPLTDTYIKFIRKTQPFVRFDKKKMAQTLRSVIE